MPCFRYVSPGTTNLRSVAKNEFSHSRVPHVFRWGSFTFLIFLLQVEGLHTFSVDVSTTNSNTDEFYYFYFDGILAIDRSPAVCLPLGTCNVGTYTISLLLSEFYRFEMQ